MGAVNTVTRSGGGVAALVRRLEALQGLVIEIGVNGREGAAVDPDDPGVTVAQKAMWAEFGSDGSDDRPPQPERPAFRVAFRTHRAKWSKRLRADLKRYVAGNLALAGVGSPVGNIARADIQNSIRNGVWAPNAPLTLANKAPKTKPWIDTGQTLQSIRYRVSRGSVELDVG